MKGDVKICVIITGKEFLSLPEL